MRGNDAMPVAGVRGMTLIEITLALLIAALVGAYAVPAYREYLARGHRQAAVNALHACALRLEAGESADGTQEAHAHRSGVDSETARTCASTTSAYRISVRGAGSGTDRGADGGAGENAQRDAPAYVIEAAPRSRGPQRADRCGVFTLDALGRRGNRHAVAHGERNFDGCWSGTRR
ncbi:MAG: type IV pilin protein [Janthinobacterium lividum]